MNLQEQLQFLYLTSNTPNDLFRSIKRLPECQEMAKETLHNITEMFSKRDTPNIKDIVWRYFILVSFAFRPKSEFYCIDDLKPISGLSWWESIRSFVMTTSSTSGVNEKSKLVTNITPYKTSSPKMADNTLSSQFYTLKVEKTHD